MEEGLGLSVSVGTASSSRMPSVRLEGALTPRPPLTVALTVIDLFGASTSLSTPVMVTAPVLLVEPASIVSVLLEEIAKSPLTAGDVGLADTVRITASEEGRLREAVTSAIPPSH